MPAYFRLLVMRVFLLVLLVSASGCATQERPNIVIILADDLGYSDIGAYGGEIRTPHLDRMARDGLRFRHFYNAGRCCPTRAALLTGRYPHLVGMGGMVSSRDSDPGAGPYQGYLNAENATIAEMLRAAGYRTYMSGKWHVGEKPEHWPRRRGFDRFFGLISGASSYYELVRDQPRIRQMALDDTPWEPPEEGFYMTDAFSEYATVFLAEHPEDTPFFLYLAYTAPHWPLHALPEDVARYRDRYHAGWDSLRVERYWRMRREGIIDGRFGLSSRPESIPAWEDVQDKEDWERRMEVYAAMVDRMDQGIGRVLEKLGDMGVLDNTLIFFLSDNGACAESVEGRRLHDSTVVVGDRGSYVAYREAWANASNTPFRLYKQWTHEGGIATPMIAHWPVGIAEPGRIVDDVHHVMDIMATAFELSGGTVGRSSRTFVEGESLVPLFAGTQQVEMEERTLYWEHRDNRAVRRGQWKLVWDHRLRVWELYDLQNDPTELHDLSAQYPVRVWELEALWGAWADSVGVFNRSRP